MVVTLRHKLLATTLLSVAAVSAAPANAQAVDATRENAANVQSDPDAGEGVETIVVTGSRIQRRDLDTASPLAVVQDEEFKLSGAVNVEQVINTLPQAVPGATAFSNNPGGGVSTLNLRGLGAARTLVLVNGRRWVSYDTSQVVDLNTVPAFLIDSVEVQTGGASAVYGSDALGGVVNFRLKQDLSGVEAGTSYAITEQGDGARWDAHVALGADFADGRGNVLIYGEYFNRKPIFQGARSFSGNALGDGANGLVPLGSATTNRGRVAVAATSVIGVDPDGVNGPLTAPTLPRGVGNFGTAFGADFATPGVSSVYDNPGDAYNYAVDNYLQVPQERWLLGGYGSYEISSAVTAFMEVAYINNRVQNELAPTPVTGTFNVSLAGVQPYLSAADFAALQQIDANETAINAARATNGLAPLFGTSAAAGRVQLGINRRINETGSRNSLDERNAFRILAGVRGPAFGQFTYEAYYSYARTRNANIQAGNISRSLYTAAVESGAINVFGPNTLSPEDVASVSILSQNGDISELQVVNASITGPLFNFGLGAEDVAIAIGGEYRNVSAEFIPDTALASGDVVGFNAGQPTAGKYDVRDVFAEVRVPLIADRPFFERLDLSGAFRYSDYSLEAVGGTESYSGQVEWAPIRDITFRGQYQRAVRAPNVGELFGGLANGFPAATDPCSSRTPAANRTPALAALCLATGVPAANLFTAGLQPNAQIEGVFGGNANLQEEVSDTYTAGVILRPSFIPRLNITVDYFNIKIDDYISTFGGGLSNTLNLCYNVIQDINSVYCQAIVNGVNGLPGRDPANGQIGGQFVVPILNANIASIETDGIDLQVDYSQPLGFSITGNGESALNFFFLGTWTNKNTFTPVVDQPDINTNCAGRFGIAICGNPQPEYKWTSRLSFLDGPMTASLRWRHLGSARDDDDTSDYITERLDSIDYFDLSFSYDLTDQFTFAVGVNNLLNETPQLIGDNQEQANTYPAVYDVLGRDYFVSANFRF